MSLIMGRLTKLLILIKNSGENPGKIGLLNILKFDSRPMALLFFINCDMMIFSKTLMLLLLVLV